MDHTVSAFELPLRMEYRPPPWLLPAFIFIILGGMVCILYTALSLLIKTALLLTLLCYARVCLRTSAGKTHKPVRLVLNADGSWLICEGKRVNEAALRYSSLLIPGVIVLHFACDGAGRKVFILGGNSLDRNTMRRLRVRLLLPRTGV